MAAACGGQKRSLAELLAKRARKGAGGAESSSQKIQEAALYLLSSHQDVSRFLLEAEDPPCKKVCGGEKVESGSALGSASLTQTFIGSTIRDQASHVGVSPGVLSAKTAVSSIQLICHNGSSSMEGGLLSQDQRDRLAALLKTLKQLLAENCFSCSYFLKTIWKQERPPVLEAMWHLHSTDIVGLEDLLESCRDGSRAVDWLCSEMRSLCRHMEDSPGNLEVVEDILCDLLAVLIRGAFSPSAKSSEPSSIGQISCRALETMLSWLLDAVLEAGDGQPHKLGVQRHWLIAYEVSRYRVRVIPESLEGFFLHSLSQTLTYRPQLTVSDAVRFQWGWSFVKTHPLLTQLYRKLFVLLNAEKVISHIQKVLNTQEVNWHHVLSFISCLVICQPESEQLIRGLLSRLLSQAFESFELEYLITAFLIARQAALEGPAAFMSYTDWFKGTFGAATSHQGSSKKSLLFLLKFLSDLVPFESPQYLKVHILHPPFVASKFRPLLMEYITLAKTRLADMKVSIEDMGLYEDLSAISDNNQAKSQAQQDVDKAVQIFENTGKIPASIMEASIFRRPYFTNRFLPALLSPRVLPEVPDSKVLLIDSLNRADKIPGNMLSVYLDACELKKHRKEKGQEKMDVSLDEEPLAKLQSALWELRSSVTTARQYDEVSSQMAKISDILASELKDSSSEVIPGTSPPLIPASAEDLQPLEATVSDLLLTSFCQCVMAASSADPPNRQGPWPTLYVRMVCGHRRALHTVLCRVLQLLCHQAAELQDAHVIGLAVFCVHLHENWTSRPSTSAEVPSVNNFWETLLSAPGSGSLPLLLRFCTAAVSYAWCRFSVSSPGAITNAVPPTFIRKLQHLLPRLVPEVRMEGVGEQDEDAPLVFSVLSRPHAGWKKAAQSLWCQTHVQELLKEPSFQLSFRDWLLWEMGVTLHDDPLSDVERQDYQRWVVSQYLLPESSTSPGCGGDLAKACAVLVEAVLDFCTGSELGSSIHLPCGGRGTGLPGILCRLQELVCDLMMSPSGRTSHVGFLLSVFHQRLERIPDDAETGSRMRRQNEIAMCCRILLGLPSSLLVSSSPSDLAALSADDFFQFVNKHLKPLSQRGYALPYDITAHFFRGLLGSAAQCEDCREAVNSVLVAAYSACPILLLSAALWWPRLDLAMRCEWNRCWAEGLPEEMEALRAIQADADSCVTNASALPLSDHPWLSAAFLYFTIQRNKVEQKRLPDLLREVGKTSVEILDCFLFLSAIDLIRLTLQGGAEHRGALESCVQAVQCLEERGGSWLTAFNKKGKTDNNLLHHAVCEESLKLLPLAFFSLAVHLPPDHLAKQHKFLQVSLKMYKHLFQLFVDEPPLLEPLQADQQAVFSRGRQFLLSSVLKCPPPSPVFQSRLPQIISSWDEKDPELAGLLRNLSPSLQDDDLYAGPDLF
ncbi:Fanconi anemia group A protein [Hyperolius riggenbachi]|uniref:Fanconi anemia group A protein n=1 Tax=Hyperolius riggenbachi TaxID=752182 RepID=UPI0035A3A9EB